MFITFEGGEGSGKSTHIRLLKKYLASKGKKALVTLEPGGTPFGKTLREILLSKKIPKISELMLFVADRVDHVEKVIRPALRKGYIVLCDRYIDSTAAYQLGGRGLPEDLVNYLNKISSCGVVPDLTFLLDLPVEKGLGRALVKTKFEKEKLSFHRAIRKQFLKIAGSNRSRVKIINAEKTISDVQEEIREICRAKI